MHFFTLSSALAPFAPSCLLFCCSYLRRLLSCSQIPAQVLAAGGLSVTTRRVTLRASEGPGARRDPDSESLNSLDIYMHVWYAVYGNFQLTECDTNLGEHLYCIV